MAEAINLVVVHTETVSLNKRRPATLLGRGGVERIAEHISNAKEDGPGIDVVIVDAALTPVQQRNLEEAWHCKVIDRTGLILEIFGERAQTKEGRLQVDLAALSYQRSRLVRSWTHLERQRGGAGFMGGPGERQIETDRRQLSRRVNRLKREIKDVKRTRQLHRKARRKVPYPVLALVGYTNAGKSTLFNALTQADVEARDQLFQTLDTTMRRIDLPSGRTVILSDTVGFISDLPHELVEAFHATLEEVTEADIMLHVRDVAHEETEDQKSDVLLVLKELGLETNGDGRMIEICNKLDLLAEDERQALSNQIERSNTAAVALSALTGEGFSELLNMVDARLSAGSLLLDLTLKTADGKALAWLYQHGDVIERDDEAENIHLKVRLDEKDASRFERLNLIS